MKEIVKLENSGELIDNYCELTSVSLKFTREIDKEEWQKVFNHLSLMDKSVHFWIGDCLAYHEQEWGMYKDLSETTGFSEKTIRSDKYVANKVESSRRRDDLSFSHHTEVAALEPEKQDYWLDKAQDEKLTRKQLRQEISKEKNTDDRKRAPAHGFEDNQLHQGNCLEILNSLPDNSIDMVLSDPPYGIDFVSNHRIDKYKEIANDNEDMVVLLDKVLQLLDIKMKDNASLYLFSSWKVIDVVLLLIKKYFRVKNLLVWNKNNWSMGDLNNYAEKYEFIIYADKGNHKLVSDKRPLNVLDYNRTTNKFHPTEKPTDLLEYLIKQSTIENELICDPFMGSGSTILAGKNTNRKYIGIEINEDYYNTACGRLQCQ